MGFRVYNFDGQDVTDQKKWMIDSNGNLCFLTESTDNPVQMMSPRDGYYWAY